MSKKKKSKFDKNFEKELLASSPILQEMEELKKIQRKVTRLNNAIKHSIGHCECCLERTQESIALQKEILLRLKEIDQKDVEKSTNAGAE